MSLEEEREDDEHFQVEGQEDRAGEPAHQPVTGAVCVVAGLEPFWPEGREERAKRWKSEREETWESVCDQLMPVC